MQSPIGIAAGILKTANLPGKVRRLCDTGLVGAITFGSFTREPRQGNPEPTYYFNNRTRTSINAVGLTNQGLPRFLEDDLPAIAKMLENTTVRIRVSLAPLQEGDVEMMSDMLASCPSRKHIDEVEINAACPNHRDTSGLHPVLAHDHNALDGLMAETRRLYLKKAIKIAPEMSEAALRNVIYCCTLHDYKVIVSGNTMLGSAVIDGVQRLSVPKGGVAGAPLLAPGIRQVEMLAQMIQPSREIELVGCGGILTPDDAARYLYAGAQGVQMATGYLEYKEGLIQSTAMHLVDEELIA